ncbi:MAG: TraR/DksA C4-type zinc finger protein [Flavobacteriales bacterium]|nr:TraR/DksA C4-type zinc finger protein [Flavobacteriales bacterium]
MLTTDQRNQLHDIILRKVEDVKADIERYTQMSQPVSPENAIGRISRMDAINNKSINEAALRNSKNKLVRLQQAQKSVHSAEFGLCRQCGDEIEFEKLMVFPESVRCVNCVKGDR